MPHRAPRSGHPPLAPHVFEILLSLINGPRHGYGIISDVRDRTEGDVLIGTSSLYAAIRRLLQQKMVEDVCEEPANASSGPPRRYYQITERGSEAVRAEADRVRRAATAAERMLANAATHGRK